jgi:HlyD family secretion protein
VSRRRVILIVAAGVGLLGALLILTWAGVLSAGEDPGEARVIREDFRSLIEATGTLEAVVSTQLGPPSIPDTWRFNLTYMAPEGRITKPGKPVMKFDATEIEDKLRERQAEFETAVKEREKEEKNLEIELEQLELTLVEARSNLERATLEAAVPEGLVSSIEAEELRLRKKMVEERVSFLEKKITARREQVAAQLKLLQVKRQRAEQRIRYYQDALDKFTVKAPSDGVIVYIRKRNGERYEVGESVWMLSKVIEVADLRTLRVSAQVLEVDAGHVRVGQPATVSVDAIPGKIWKSRVEQVGTLVRPRSEKDPGKVFDAFVPLDEIDSKMRPGMSVQVEIEEKMIPGALTIPVTAVRDREGTPYVIVTGAAGREEREVSLGPRNHDRIVVLEGLEEGERLVAFAQDRAGARGGAV